MPTIESVAPASAAPGSTLTVQVTGTYLYDLAYFDFGPGMTVQDSFVNDEHHADGAHRGRRCPPPAARSVLVQNDGYSAGPRTGGLGIGIDAFRVG